MARAWVRRGVGVLACLVIIGGVVFALWWFSPSQRVKRLVQELADAPGIDSFLRYRRPSEDIISEFASLGSSAVPPLLDLLRGPEGEFRRIAAHALGMVGGPECVPALIAALSDREKRVRAAAAGALGCIKDPRAVDALLAALDDEDGWVRAYAAGALGRIGDKRAIGPLIKAVETDTARAAAARALARLGAKEGIPAMVAALKDKEDFIRKDVAIALGQLGSLEAVPELITGLLHTAHYPGDRLEIIDLLVKLRDPRAREALAQAAATDITSEVREAARKALLAFPDARPSSGTSPGSAPVR